MPNAYEINGTGIPIDPTEGRWLEQDIEGLDGNGRAIYSRTRDFEMRWGLLSPGQLWQADNWCNGYCNCRFTSSCLAHIRILYLYRNLCSAT
jgi:hypothetical protein